MKSNYLKTMVSLLTLILCLAAFLPACAEEPTPLTVDLNVDITLSGTRPRPAEKYTIRMTADDDSFPMPNGAFGGSADLIIKGAHSGTFPTIQYDGLGIYTYTITQIAGKNKDCKYDPRVYQMKVTVTNNEQGEGYSLVVALHEDDKTEKPDTVHFHNKYKTIVTPPGDITPTGDGNLGFYYIGGCVLLLVAAGFIIRSFRRRGSDCHHGDQ